MRISPGDSRSVDREIAVGRTGLPKTSRQLFLRAKREVLRRKLHDAMVLIHLIALRYRHHVRDFGFL